MSTSVTFVGAKVVAAIAVFAIGVSDSFAQIRTDSSFGRSAQTLTGPNVIIPEMLGRLSGSNLFHSFQLFNVNVGESATFTTVSTGISNVISRVTGGSPSSINGAITLLPTSGAPNLYFINPAGVAFGAGASLNVPGAFHVSTADYLRFPDGKFYADPQRESVFSSADPAAFGFLGAARAPLQLSNSLLDNPTGTLSLVAGDVSIDNSGAGTKGGGVRVAAVGGAAVEVGMAGELPVLNGNLTLSNGSGIYSETAAGADGGAIRVSAGDTSIRSGSLIYTVTSNDRNAGAIHANFGGLVVDGRSAPGLTGITSQTLNYSSGASGDVSVAVWGNARILGGGLVSSESYAKGHSGNVSVRAGTLLLDGEGHTNSARVSNRTGVGGAGDSGALSVAVDDSLTLVNGAMILGDSFNSGRAGNIQLHAGNSVSVLSGSSVSSESYAAGNAGTVDISARNLTIDGTGSGALKLTEVSSSTANFSSGAAGTVNIALTDDLRIVNGGRVNASTDGAGKGGDVHVETKTLLIDGMQYFGSTGILSTTDFNSTNDAGNIRINVAAEARLLNNGQISSGSWSSGHGGDVTISAGNLSISGPSKLARSGVLAEANSSGHGGSVAVNVSGVLQLLDSGTLSTSTSGAGDAGRVTINAGQLIVDGRDSASPSIQSATYPESTGNAGTVSVSVSGDALITSGGRVSSRTRGTGRGGEIHMGVSGTLSVGANGSVLSDTEGNNDAGDISIEAGNIVLDRVAGEGFAWIRSDSYGRGRAGGVSAFARGRIDLGDGGFISSDAYDAGHAGRVCVNASEIRIGRPGLLYGAAVSSDTYSSGNAGQIFVAAKNLTIERNTGYYPTGISTRSYENSSGDSGTVVVSVDRALQVHDGGAISSSTSGLGRGGYVQVDAGSIDVSGTDSRIVALAASGSSGLTGNVAVHAIDVLRVADSGFVSIENQGDVVQTSGLASSLLSVQAGSMFVDKGAILANSTGNAAAGELRIRFGERLSLNRGQIATTANNGDGGAISISGGRLIDLAESRITTSVLGEAGNGGNIALSGEVLVLNTGFIQANTAARAALGGNVDIRVQALLSSGNSLFVGGKTSFGFVPGIFGFNVIQAAAPTGVSGTIGIAAPALDLSGALVGLNAKVTDTVRLGRSPCRTAFGSSLAVSGRSGLLASSRGWGEANAGDNNGYGDFRIAPPSVSGLGRECLQ